MLAKLIINMDCYMMFFFRMFKINNEQNNVSIKRMPLKNLTEKASSSFKSPILNRKVSNTNENENEILEKINCLEIKIKNAETEIKNLQMNYTIDDIDSIIKKLHTFNEIKDIAQILMGKIADIKLMTIKEVHIQFNAQIETD